MNARTTGILTSLAVSLITALVGSDIIAAEIFTDYYISPQKVQPEQYTPVTVQNIGWLQANDAVVQIISNGTISNYENVCAEGKVWPSINNNTLIVEFSRMSPKIKCHIGLVAPEYVQLDMVVSSDGRITPWTMSSYIPWLSWITLITMMTSWLVIPYILTVLIFRKLYKTELYNRFKLWEYRNSFKKAENSIEIRQYVQKEYQSKITDADATVLKLIYLQKTTMGQLRKHTGLPLDRVRYIVEKMRRYELISKEKMEIHDTLDNFFRCLRQMDPYG